MSVVVVSKASEPAVRAALTAAPKRVEAVDSHSDSPEPIFDVVPVVIVKMTAQIVPREGSQIPSSIDKKLCVGNIVILGETMQ